MKLEAENSAPCHMYPAVFHQETDIDPISYSTK